MLYIMTDRQESHTHRVFENKEQFKEYVQFQIMELNQTQQDIMRDAETLLAAIAAESYPAIMRASRKLDLDLTIIDGEIVAR